MAASGIVGNQNPAALARAAGRGPMPGQIGRMPPTLFASWDMFAGQTIQVVGRKKWPQRVILQDVGLGNVFVSDSPGAGVGPKAIAVPPTGPMVLVLAPGQDLYAQGTLNGGLLALAVSAPIPSRGGPKRMGPSSFDAQPSGQLLDLSDVPRRVTVSTGATTAQIASQANLVNPSGAAFQMLGLTLYTFVLAPGQALFGQILTGVGSFNVHSSDLVTSAPRGPTGIPGPDGQE